MDIEDIRKAKHSNLNKTTAEQLSTLRKTIERTLDERKNKIAALKENKNRIEEFQQLVKNYEKAKSVQYNEILEAIKKSNTNLYNKFKQHEKKYGWKRTTKLLEDYHLMERWVNFVVPIMKYTEKPSKVIPPDEQPDNQLPKDLPLPPKLPSSFTEEDQYVYTRGMEDNLDNKAAKYLRRMMMEAGFGEYQIDSLLKILTPGEIYQIAIEFHNELAKDDDAIIFLTTPDFDTLIDDENELNAAMERGFNLIIKILERHGKYYGMGFA